MDTNKNEQIQGSEALIRALVREGVDTIFGYPGGAIMPVYDTLMDHADEINHILVRHEQGATHAAEGYARASGKTGVCLVTGGPGATNTLTGIADAMLDSTPVVVIAGQIATDMIGTDAFQEVDFTCVTQPVCKWSYQISTPDEISRVIARAFFVARTGRPGPVVLSITKDAQTGMTEYVPEKVTYIRSYDYDPEIDITRIREAAAAINSARRPFVLAGQGIELGGAQEEFREFVEKGCLPFGCTLLGLSVLPTSHPLNKGMLGMHGNLCNNVKTNECDVLIAVGMRFDDRVTGDVNTYARQARIIHLDIDPAEIGKNVRADIPILGNCRKSLAMLTERLVKTDRSEWCDSFRKYRPGHTRDGCGPEPDDGCPLFQIHGKAQYHHFRRHGDNGFRHAGGNRGGIRQAGQDRVRFHGGRRTADDTGGTRHCHGAQDSAENDSPEQQLSRQRPPVAGTFL